MALVAIIGAGEIGGAVARALASQGRVDTIRLIDEKASVASGLGTGVADENVDLAEAPERALDHLPYLTDVRDIGEEAEGAAAHPFDLGDDAVDALPA